MMAIEGMGIMTRAQSIAFDRLGSWWKSSSALWRFARRDLVLRGARAADVGRQRRGLAQDDQRVRDLERPVAIRVAAWNGDIWRDVDADQRLLHEQRVEGGDRRARIDVAAQHGRLRP